ncbi:hypothetical protein L596_025930 [Steinernema carpocapsae]|uniref:G-protein coupled receptors family 1 profile domain-containing protein n=1 Tax=Steinernema carpocapsae TaxID=34508 RepID=A0A4U5M965_STECR|nr:hypothetical protein L596_025930 [Steinernema carpocapsae]
MFVLLCVTAALMFLIGGFGIFGNLNLIWATYRTLPSNKKASCAHLIGTLAFLDLICIVFEYENALRLLLDVENHRRSCFWAISPYLYSSNFQAYLILFIALDRVYAMLYPIKYRRIKFWTYIAVSLTPGFIFASIFSVAQLDDEFIEACNPPLGYPPLISMIWSRWILVMDSATIVLYIVALLALYVNITQNDKIQRRVLVLDPTTKDHEDPQRRRCGLCVFLVFLPRPGALCYNDRP